jgi:Ca2+-binding RTX toxin-like protein
MALNLNLYDIEFILEQIELSFRHVNADGSVNGAGLRAEVGDPLLSYGLRTVDGSFNNLVPGRELFGSADRAMPQLLTQFFRSAEAMPVGFFGPNTGGGAPTSYAVTGTLTSPVNVFDSQPRMISNLISDQTAGNAAAVATQQRHGDTGNVSSDDTLFIGNIAPDEGLSAPFNSWFTLFGQFFDHGLDLTDKGGGTVFIPLAPDDPLYNPDLDGADNILGTADDARNFMTVTRTLNQAVLPGPDNTLGTADDIHIHTNQTTPFVDQNQTYGSNAAHQAFMRDYDVQGGRVVSTGYLLDGSAEGGLANWAQIKEQARSVLGIDLTDADVTNVPQLAVNEYGQLILGPNGRPQLMTGSGLVEGNPAAPISTANALRTGHAFLDDIAHSAAPRGRTGNMLTPDADDVAGGPVAPGQYDNELLDAHFVTGDGRGNENIGLTTVHHIFHAEHNRLVDYIKETISPGGVDTPLAAGFRNADGSWNGERLFQAARFGNEMQYQHLVFEEFARTIQPQIDAFAGYDVTIDPAITAEFAHVVYRFGHSMLTDTVDLVNDAGAGTDVRLIDAFLNPQMYVATGGGTGNANYLNDAAEAVVRGMTRQQGNAIDEFLTESVRNNLVGLPLDLGAVNITRGRDAGVPGLNAARQQFFAATGDNALAPYENWLDFRDGIKNPESLVNFIAAYGTHESITSATDMAGRRAAATALVNGSHPDSAAFLNQSAATSGVNNIDFWIGGLAERTMPFGGMLGSSFNFVFETQMERLQDGDRLYYLARTAGLNFLTELEGNSFADLIMRNLPGVKHLPGNVFTTPDHTIEAGDANVIANYYASEHEGNLRWTGAPGASELRYTGGEHIVLGGTEGNDILRAGDGDDTIYGDGGNDRIEGGAGNDFHIGGAGNDILTDAFGDDNIKGGDGNDVISTGSGIDLVLGGAGSDFSIHGSGLAETFGGAGNDFIIGGTATDTVVAGEGDDWMEGGGQADLLQGDNANPFQNSPILGHDVVIGGGGNDDYDMESGDDIGLTGEGTERVEGMLGFDWAINQGDGSAGTIDLSLGRGVVLPPAEDAIRDRYDLVEGASGWHLNDSVRGDNRLTADLTAIGAGDPAIGGNNELNSAGLIDRITGLRDLLPNPTAASFSGGNILLGGGGNDRIEGLAGDDVLDGDAYLRVQLQYNGPTFGSIVNGQRFNSLTELQGAALAGLDPGNIAIVREIVVAGAAPADALAVNGVTFQAVAGNDRLDGGTGSDLMRGRLGNDTYVVDVTTDQTIEALGEGTDTVESSINWTLAQGNNIENLTLLNLPQVLPTDPITANPLTGTGNELDNVITGNVANNVLTGLLGNDTLNGGAGVDTMVGGQGNDIYFVDVAGDVTTEAAGEGTDLVNSLVTRTLGANLENLTLIGTAAINGTGNDLANIIVGNSAANVLDGLGGVDAMSGGAGNDTYVVDNSLDTANENFNEGTDLVNSSATFTLGANVENLTLTGAGVIDGTGNELANTINGNAQNNLLFGLGGNDIIISGNGNDTLDGGTGVDAMTGGQGDDTYVVDDSADTVTEANNQGTDRVNASASFTLVGQIEFLTLVGAAAINGTGSNIANTITGNEADNVLSGAGGADTLVGNGGNDTLDGGNGIDNMTGGLGNDTYVVDDAADVVNEAAGEGTADRISTGINTSYSLETLANVENLSLTGTGGTGIGNGSDNIITSNGGANTLRGLDGNDTLDSGGGADTLEGGQGNDTLFGRAGADRLDGGAGADRMEGGTGDDTYIVDDAGDVVIEVAGEGNADAIESSVSFSTGDNVESLTLTGAANANATGGAGAQALFGNIGNNTLDGGAGNDAMSGGLGDDIYVVDANGDVTTEVAGAGTDTVRSAVTRNLATTGANIENLLLGGTLAINGTGNALDNVIIGNGAANTLNGGLGNDRLEGGGGNDILNVVDGNDILVFRSAGFGNDTVQAGFDATAAGGQDLIDISGLGITSATFGSVLISQAGLNTVINIGGELITLTGVSAATVDISDFILA